MYRENKNLGSRPWLVILVGIGVFVALLVLGLLFAYFGWWGGVPDYPPPTIP